MTPTILVVEDEPAIRELIRVNVQHAGYTPAAVDSAETSALYKTLLPGSDGSCAMTCVSTASGFAPGCAES